MLSNLRVVLVETQYSGNIGSVARAMENCGLSDLVLVRPTAELDRHARAMAASAGKTLNSARTVESFDAAVGDCVFSVGFTASKDKGPKIRRDYPVLVQEILEAAASRKVALVFGREDWGLDNEVIYRCRYLTTLPTHPDYESLNLAQAVLLACHPLFVNSMSVDTNPTRVEEASVEEREGMYKDVEETLQTIGYFSSDKIVDHTLRHVRRIIEKARLAPNEVAVIRGFCRHLRWAKSQDKI